MCHLFTFSCCQVTCFLSNTDIAIGAPHDDGGTGKVYIYHGSAQGIKTSPAQVGFCRILLKTAVNNIFKISYVSLHYLPINMKGFDCSDKFTEVLTAVPPLPQL